MQPCGMRLHMLTYSDRVAFAVLLLLLLVCRFTGATEV
jgi:hypothetical protein